MAAIDIITKEDLQLFKQELFSELKQFLLPTQQGQKQWLKSSEVRTLLNISPGTLQNLRINGTLRYTKIGGILYYKQEDISGILESAGAGNGSFTTSCFLLQGIAKGGPAIAYAPKPLPGPFLFLAAKRIYRNVYGKPEGTDAAGTDCIRCHLSQVSSGA